MERPGSERRHADGGGLISFGQEAVGCRIIDLSETGAQVRIDGKRASITLEGDKPRLLAGRVVWARPAVNGVYLGIAVEGGDTKPVETASQ